VKPARAVPAPPVPARTVVSASSPAAGLWLRRTVVALWIVAGSVALLVVLSRLFAAAVPVTNSGGGAPAGEGGAPDYQYYDPGYYPGGGRFGQGGPGGLIQVP